MAALMVPSFRITVYVGAGECGPGLATTTLRGTGHQAAKCPSWTVALTGPFSTVLMTTEATSEPTRPVLHEYVLSTPPLPRIPATTVFEGTAPAAVIPRLPLNALPEPLSLYMQVASKPPSTPPLISTKVQGPRRSTTTASAV